MRGLAQTLHILVAELRAEWRSRQLLATMLLLAGLCAVTFGFAGRAGSTHLAAPALWVSLVLAAAAGVAQLIARHEASEVDAALRIGGAAAWARFLGRLLAFFVPVLATAGLLWALTGVLFGAGWRGAPWLGLLLALGALGLAALGTTVALSIAGAATGPSRLVPLLLIPLALPLLLIGASGTRSLATSGAAPAALLRLAVADVVLIGLGLIVATRPSRGPGS